MGAPQALCRRPGEWLACYGEGDFAVIGRDIFGRSYSKV
jgi:hypothetical protein